ncbi:MAG: Ig-like domain-containing protein [Candidatus Thorarchaeota archaeon]
MRTTHANLTVYLLLCMLISQIPVLTQYHGGFVSQVSRQPSATPDSSSAGGEEHYVTNVFQNGRFEEPWGTSAPPGFSGYGTGLSFANTTYRDLVANGSQSALLEALGSRSWEGYVGIWQDLGGKLNLGSPAYLNVSYYIVSTGYLSSSGYIYVDVQSRSSSQVSRTLRYVLSANPSQYFYNFSARHTWVLDFPTGTWVTLHRNLTEDFQNAFGSSAGDYNVTGIQLSMYSGSPSDWSQVVFDDVKVRNATFEAVTNGGFEASGSKWSIYKHSPSEAVVSTDHTEGQYSLNMSCWRANDGSSRQSVYSYRSNGHGFFPQTAPVTVSFDWKYNDTYNGGGQYAYFELRFANSSTHLHVVFVLGHDLNGSSWTNNTWYTYLNAAGFGVRGQWQRFELDVNSFVEDMGWKAMYVDYFDFYMAAGSYMNSTVTLLVDNFSVTTYPAGDPGFEVTEIPNYNTETSGWDYYYGSTSTNLVTNVSHSGEHALNLTLTGGAGTTGVLRYMTVDFPNATFTDFWWRLDTPLQPGSAVYVIFGLDGNRELCYVLHSNASGFSNSSMSVFIDVGPQPQIGEWQNFVRNLPGDIRNVFGNVGNRVDYVLIAIHAGSSDTVSALFDDIHFVLDTHAPQIDVERDIASPTYYQDVRVRAAIDDLSSVSATLYYRLNGGGWTSVPMVLHGSEYVAAIPAQSYGTVVEYYVVAQDALGNMGVDDNGGAYYSYDVGDDIGPAVEVLSPFNRSIVRGIVTLSFNATDPDASSSAGMGRVEVWANSTLVANITSAPYLINWNSTALSNGAYVLTAKAFDRAGNTGTHSILVTVDNDVDAPVISEPLLDPTPPRAGTPVRVIVYIHDASSVERAVLHYSVAGGSWNEVDMSSTGDTYAAEIPAVEYGVEVSYYVTATDSVGHSFSKGTQSSPYAYSPVDPTAPQLVVQGPAAGSTLRDNVAFTLVGSDAESGIDSLAIYVDGNLVGTVQDNEGTFTIDTTTLTNGVHTFTFVATNNAGDTTSVGIEYTVSNPQGAEALSAALAEVVAQYGLLIGAAVAVVLIVVIHLVQKKRG